MNRTELMYVVIKGENNEAPLVRSFHLSQRRVSVAEKERQRELRENLLIAARGYVSLTASFCVAYICNSIQLLQLLLTGEDDLK